VVNLVNFEVDRGGHIVANELKLGVAEVMDYVGLLAAEQTIKANDLVTGIFEEAVDKVGTDETSPSGD